MRRRTGLRSAGWRADLLMVAIACGLVLLAFPTVAFGGRTFGTGWRSAGVNGVNDPPPGIAIPPGEEDPRPDPGASAWQFEPWAKVQSQAWHDGSPPLWNPYQGLGAPLAANLQSAAFDPFLAAVHLHPTPLTWDVSFFVALFLGAAAMYLFLRQIGLDRIPALAGTAPFLLSGFFFLLSNNHFVRSYLYLPVLLALAQRTLRSDRWWAPVALGFAVCGNLFVGMPEPSIFILGALVLYCVFLTVFPPVPIARGRVLLRFGGALLLGLALAAPLLLPAFEYIRASFNGHAPGDRLGLLADQPTQLIGWFIPHLLGKPGAIRGAHLSETLDWVGMAAAVATVGALACPRTIRRHGGYFFLALATVLLAKGYGYSGLQWVGRLPLLERLIFPQWGLPVVAFCVGVLVGIGVQGLSDGDLQRRRFLTGSAALLAAVAALFLMSRSNFIPATAGHYTRQVALAAAATATVIAGFIGGRRRGPILVTGAIVAELLLLAPRGFFIERVDSYVHPAWLRYIVDKTGPSNERVFATDAKLAPNLAGAYGLFDIRATEALYPARYVNYIRHFIQPEFRDRFVGGPFGSTERHRGETDDNPMFDLTGVRYVVAGVQQPGDNVIREAFRTRPPSDNVRISAVHSPTDVRFALAIRPGHSATVPVPQGATTLAFAVGRIPNDASPEAGLADAVIRAWGAQPGILWSRTVPPAQGIVWQDFTIALPNVRSIELGVTSASPTTISQVGFTDMRFGFGTDPPPKQYRHLMGSDGADVWENTRHVPRSLVVHRITPVKDETAALDFFRHLSRRLPSGALRVEKFDPTQEAVVEGIGTAASGRLRGCETPGRATIRSYDADDVVIDVEAACPGLVVLTDVYFPGWRATVNGKSATIHPTDIAFRGVPVEAGRSTVRFRYRPTSFRLGLRIALIGLIAAPTTIAVTTLRRRRTTQHRPG